MTESDVRAVTELVFEYAACLDRKDWPGWRDVFAEDIEAEYGVWGMHELLGVQRGREPLVEWMRETMEQWPVTHHLMANVQVWPDGEGARSRAYVLASNVTPGERTPMQTGGWYDNRYARTPDGWRMTRLRFEMVWASPSVPGATD